MPYGAGDLEIVLMVISIERQWVEQPDGLSGSFNHVMTVLTRRRAARLSARL
jgi:hypothetical protein